MVWWCWQLGLPNLVFGCPSTGVASVWVKTSSDLGMSRQRCHTLGVVMPWRRFREASVSLVVWLGGRLCTFCQSKQHQHFFGLFLLGCCFGGITFVATAQFSLHFSSWLGGGCRGSCLEKDVESRGSALKTRCTGIAKGKKHSLGWLGRGVSFVDTGREARWVARLLVLM
jgi:hypothetical protein